uniref:Uncharacterized protein n=1 Tax=Globodera rostochiensis TaxID=31243 RepID=A0A914I5T6_GLORO
MENWDNFLPDDTHKHEFKQSSKSTNTENAFEMHKKPKNPLYTTTDDADDDDDGIKTPKIAMLRAFGGEINKPIYLQLLLDGKTPVEQLLNMEMPQELKDEVRDWDANFPDLHVNGTCVGESGTMRDMRRQIARNIVHEYLWPELQSVLSTKLREEQRKLNQKMMKKKSPKPTKKDTKSTGTVKLPPINSKF